MRARCRHCVHAASVSGFQCLVISVQVCRIIEWVSRSDERDIFVQKRARRFGEQLQRFVLFGPIDIDRVLILVVLSGRPGGTDSSMEDSPSANVWLTPIANIAAVSGHGAEGQMSEFSQRLANRRPRSCTGHG